MLPILVSNLASNATNKFESKISGKGVVRAGKGFTFFISNEDMNNIIKIIKLLEDWSVLIDRVTETGSFGALLTPLAASMVQRVIASVVIGKSGRRVRRAWREYMNENF